MADTTALKNRIRAAIKANDNQEITGPVLQQALLDIVDELNGATETEASTRSNADSQLQTNIDNEATTRNNADTQLQTNIDNEATTRNNADTQLNNLITGIKNNIDNGYVYAGIATPSITPVSGKVFYVAIQAGTYVNFNDTTVTQGINILKYDGSAWSKDSVIGIDDIPTKWSNNLVKSNGIKEEFDNITTGKIQALTLNEGYLSPAATPAISASSNYHYSNPFHVTRGQTVTLTCWVNSTVPFTVIASYKNNVYTKLEGSASSSTDFEQKTYTYKAYEDTDIVVCGRTQGGKTIDVLVSDGTEMADKASVDSLQNDVIGLLGAIDGYEPELTLTKGYFVAANGAKTASTGPYCYTAPIQLNKGDRIVANINSISTLCAISIVNASNVFQSSIATGRGKDEYIYVAENDCYVCLSFNYSNNYNVKIIRSSSDISIDDDTESGVQATQLKVNLKKNFGTKQNPDVRVLDTLIIQEASEQKAGLLPANSEWDNKPIKHSKKIVKSDGIKEEFDNITTGKIQALTLNEGYLSPAATPAISASSNYHYSNPFHVTRGQVVTLTCWVNSTLPFTVIASYKNNVYTKLEGSASSSTDFEQKTYTYKAYEDTDIVVCGRTQGGKTIDVLVSDGTEMADKASVDSLQNDVIGLLGAIDGYEPELTLTKGYFIALNGTKTASTGPYCYTAPIQLNKGDRIVLNCVTYSNQLCTISIVNSSNGFISRVYVGKSDQDNHEYAYVAENDCYVCLCFNYRYNYNVKIKKADDKTQGLIDYAEIELSHDISRQYYNFDQHDYADGVGLWFSKTISINGEKYLYISKGQTSTGVTSAVALINFLDSSDTFISAHYAYISNSSPIVKDLAIPNNAAKVIINLPANWGSAEIKVWFINSVGTKFEKLETSVIWKEKYFNNSLYILDQYYDTSAREYKPGNGVWKSLKVGVNNAKIIQVYHQLISSTNKATLNFFDNNDNFISAALVYNKAESELSYTYCVVPENADYVLITTLTYPPHDKSRFWIGYNYTGDTHIKRFNTVRDMAANYATGLCRVGQNKLFTNIVSNPILLSKTEPALPVPYFDNNKTSVQYEAVDNKNSLQYRILNKLGGYEKSFVPEDTGYTRIVVGKSEDDVFFVSYVSSSRNGAAGLSTGNKLEITRDFEAFTTIWQPSGSLTSVTVKQVKELANGKFIVFAQYNESGYYRNGYWRLSKDFSTIEHIYCTDLEGNQSVMNGTDLKDGSWHVSDCYDWHIAIVANKVLCSEYGDRTDYGRVFYSEDSGETFKEVFRVSNHYNEGINPDDPTVVTQTHVHGVMIDEFTGRLIVVAGESNRGVFYSDKGINTTDSDWKVVRVYDQLPLRHTRYTQLISAQTFKDCLIFGSDCEGFGGYYRLNKIEDGNYSELEIAHECTPYVLYTTSYCAASSHKAENGFPAFLCMTRENHAQTEEANEELCREHYGRVLATFDGYHFVEIYKDTTFGTHTIYNESTQAIEQHDFSYCTRDMNIYVCKNGDVVIKYAGRGFVYLGAEGYVQGTGDFSARVYIIKGAAKYLKA